MNEGVEIQTMPKLVRHILDHWEKKQKESLALETEQRERLSIEIRKEQVLEKKLMESRSIARQMEREYLQIEAKIESEKRAQIEVNSIREKDVLEGRVTLAEFTKKGISEKTIYEKASRETVEDMKQSMAAARAKNLEILNFEKELLECQTKIRYLIIEPGRILQRSLKDLAQFAEFEIGHFLEEVHNSKAALEQAKGKLLLASKGQSLTPGFVWTRLSLEAARKVIFSPILPIELIPKLKAELERFKDAETVTINYYIRSRTVEVNSFQAR